MGNDSYTPAGVWTSVLRCLLLIRGERARACESLAACENREKVWEIRALGLSWHVRRDYLGPGCLLGTGRNLVPEFRS